VCRSNANIQFITKRGRIRDRFRNGQIGWWVVKSEKERERDRENECVCC
jgi:hypothetical protein